MPLRWKFSREFKLEAVMLVTERGVDVARAIRDLDVGESVLRRWIRELAEARASTFRGHGGMRSEQVEFAALRKEVARLKAERDMLRKGGCVFRKGVGMKFALIAKHRHIWPVSWICEALGVSRSGIQAS